jgi:N-acetylglucosamine-6-phosphate deacetylase
VSSKRRPILFHVHGLGEFDFSALTPEDLDGVQSIARDRGVDVIPTIFLRRDYLKVCKGTLEHFYRYRPSYPNIAGFAMEGPLLGPVGGTPKEASWMPSVAEWGTIASLGSVGLRYLVLAPDAVDPGEEIGTDYTLRALVTELHQHGTLIALGHFSHDDPLRSAKRACALIDVVQETYGPSRYLVLTDHLFNDMPRNFVHSWRGDASRRRDAELADFLHYEWSAANNPDMLGPVPAALLEAARDGRLTLCLNFDGAHVDLEICRKTVEYVGAEAIVAITDHIERNDMAGEALSLSGAESLWYRADGVVAAGVTDLASQVKNMHSVGLGSIEVDLMTRDNPHNVLAHCEALRG